MFNAIASPIRRDLALLLVLTLVIQSVMYLSYPLPDGRMDDNLAAQSFMIDELLNGNHLIGNVRYNSGYAYMISPLRALTRTLGRLDDRAFLLAQLVAYSAIPFLVYDMLRRRFDARTGLIAALVVLLDPFGLQWAHFLLPEWLIALAAIVAFWLAQLAWAAGSRRRLLLVALAAGILGLMIIARLNFAPAVAVYGCGFLFWRHIPWRQRLALFGLVACISAGILGAYTLLIQVPSTGGSRLSCTSGTTLLSAALVEDVPLLASNGPASARYAELLTLRDTPGATIGPGRYAYWRIPGPWVDQAAREAFFAQPIGAAQETIAIAFPLDLFSYMGPCPLNDLLSDVALEAYSRQLGKFALQTLRDVANMALALDSQLVFPLQYLDRPHEIDFDGEGAFGIYRAYSDHYSGHRVWKPGIVLYSQLFPALNLIKLLTPVAMAAALWKRDWLLITVAALQVTSLVAIAAAATNEPRYFAMVAPLGVMLVGWLLAQVWQWISRAIGGGLARERTHDNSP